MIIFDLPREKHAKTTLFVNIETEIADFENRRGKRAVSTQKEGLARRPEGESQPSLLCIRRLTYDARRLAYDARRLTYVFCVLSGQPGA